VQEGKLACASFPPKWKDVQNALLFVLEGKLACTSIPLLCNVVVGNVVFLC
jgi:hypothetical protein